MKSHRIGITLITIFLVIIFFSPLLAYYEITDLSALAGGYPIDIGRINNDGVVVGSRLFDATHRQAFVYRDGQIVPLSGPGVVSSDAIAINNHGHVVGCVSYWENGTSFSALWVNDNLVELGISGSTHSCASGVNNSGEIVGQYTNVDGATHAYLWQNNTIIDLGALGGPNNYSYATDINNSSQVIGLADIVGPPGWSWFRAFLWQNGLLTDLGTVGDPPSSSWASAINDKGEIVGAAGINNGLPSIHAVLWKDGGTIDLGLLPLAYGGAASDINEAGQIVGTASYFSYVYNGVLHHAFLIENGLLMDLNDLVDRNSGYIITDAYGINDSGHIIGKGLVDGEERVILLTPGTQTTVVPSALHFGFSQTGTTSTAELTITNTGSSELAVHSVVITGTAASLFDIAPGGATPCASLTPVIPPIQGCTLIATFSPTSVGTESATLQFVSSDPRSPLTEVSLSGEGVNPAISVTPTDLDFGVVQVGDSIVLRELTITNTGIADLFINMIEITGTSASVYSVALGGTNPCKNMAPTLPPGMSCTVEVTFAPSGTGPQSAILAMRAPNALLVQVPLSAKGIIGNVTIFSPNGGEIWESGSLQTVSWGAIPEASAFKVQYSKNGGRSWNTVERATGNTNTAWKLPNLKQDDHNFLARVIAYDRLGNKIGSDASDNFFALQVVTITFPGEGDACQSGNPCTISWMKSPQVLAHKAYFSYSLNGGRTWKKIPDALPGTTTSYDWIPPLVSEKKDNCKVRIILRDESGKKIGVAVSEGEFTLGL